MLTLPTRTPLPQPDFLPASRADMDRLGWEELDVLLINGDAYVDHPSFGAALLGRWLTAHGYRTGVVAQPAWAGEEALEGSRSIVRMGRPRLCVGVSAGAIDSMLAHYTAFRKKRHDDAYTPGGRAGARPNRAVTVYANLARRAFPGLPVLGGGIEASLRRVSHYDFWTDSLRRSLLFDARLDLLLFGMGERALLEAVRRLDAWAELTGAPLGPAVPRPVDLLAGVRGTARLLAPAETEETGEAVDKGEEALRPVRLPAHEAILADPRLLMQATLTLERETHQGRRALLQDCDGKTLVVMPPAHALSRDEMDALYALPFARRPHPSYRERIPAFEMIATSITTHRGCGGGCSFCSLALHQGRRVASRSEESILAEARRISGLPGGSSISDVGGPSANMWSAECTLASASRTAPCSVASPAPNQARYPGEGRNAGGLSGGGRSEAGARAATPVCTRASCLHPSICRFFRADQKACVELLRKAAKTPGVRHVRVASGVRFDLALRDPEALAAYTGEFTGGQLKVAPEHCSAPVLDLMRKPGMAAFEAFLASFRRQSQAAGKEQYVVPYLMSAFPGCTDAHMRELAAWLAERGWSPRQVQCFIPTPGTVATAMFHACCAPDGSPLHVARSDAERLRQHAILLGRETERQERAGKRRGHEQNPGRRPAKAPRNADATAPRGRRPRRGY